MIVLGLVHPPVQAYRYWLRVCFLKLAEVQNQALVYQVLEVPQTAYRSCRKYEAASTETCEDSCSRR
jgi:hypothetical protein